MRRVFTSRGSMVGALLVGLLAGLSGVAFGQGHGGRGLGRASSYSMRATSQNRGFGGQEQRPAPIERRPPPGGGVVRSGPQPLVGPNGRRGGEHLPEWMERHNGMTLEQQQAALDREPGFRDLPPQTQAQMHQRLAQLNAMTPERRARTLEHTEAMERLNPAQRSQVRGAMQQLASLPMDQRRQVMRSFRELRLYPPEQRFAVMNSPRYGWLNYEQKTVLTNLIFVAPLLPPE